MVASELVADENQDFDFVVDFSTISGVTPGTHRMRLRGEDDDQDGDVLIPCDDLEFGRTNDYTANISGELGVDDTSFSDAEFIITSSDNKMFDLEFSTTTYTEDLNIHVYNTLGQNLAFYTLEHNGAGYSKSINMSYVASGVYFVRIGDKELNKVQRIIVK